MGEMVTRQQQPATAQASELHAGQRTQMDIPAQALTAVFSDDALDPTRTFKLEHGDRFPINGDTYTVQRTIGKGGEGTSYLVLSDKGARKVLKVQRETGGDDLERKLRSELLRANTALGTDTRVVRLNAIDVGILRDYIDGVNLFEYVEATNRIFTQHETIACLTSVLEQYLSPLHAERIVHKDVKPQNIIITETDKGRAYTLIDFGLLRQDGDDVTITLSVKGTPGYAKFKATHEIQDDYYGLAETAYFLLSGKQPQSTWTDSEDKQDDLTKFERLSVDPELKKVLLKMLGHTGRYESPTQVLADIKKVAKRITPESDSVIDLSSARTLTEYRTKVKPSEELLQEITGLKEVFKEIYDPVRFAKDRPLDKEFRGRLDDVLKRLHYAPFRFENERDIFTRKRLHDGGLDVLVVKKGSEDYFDYFQATEKDLSGRLEYKDLDNDAWYVLPKNTVGRLSVPLIWLGIGSLLGGPVGGLIAGSIFAGVSGIAAAINETDSYPGSSNDARFTRDTTAWAGLLPVCTHHTIGKATYAIANGLHKANHASRSGQTLFDVGCLEQALSILPLYTYEKPVVKS